VSVALAVSLIALTILALNLWPGEKKIEHRIEPLYAVGDPQFVQSMGSLLGPDNRSFRLNDEANLNLLDADFAREQVSVFEADRARSRRVTLEEWKKRPLSEKIMEHATAILHPLL
jgi:hypothetical protein